MNQGQTVQTTTATIGQEVQLLRQMYSPFIRQDFLSLIEKNEKIASALYLVTLHLSDTNSIAVQLRTTATELLNAAMSYTDTNSVSEKKFLESMMSLLQVARSQVQMAALVELVSDRNALLLEREILKSHALVLSAHKNIQEDFAHNQERSLDSFFVQTTSPVARSVDVQKISDATAKSVAQIIQSAKEKTNNASSFPSVVPMNQSPRSDAPTRNVITRGNFDNPKGVDNLSFSTHQPVAGMTRQMDIMRIVKEKTVASIKDIAALFPDISEKTIQRDLQALVAKSVLKKTGERRWAKYSLI